MYVFALKPYESEAGTENMVGQAAAGASGQVTVPLNLGTSQDRLYSKFVLGVFNGTSFETISEPHYITNPEAVAENTAPFKDPLTKKGLNIEIDMLSDALTWA